MKINIQSVHFDATQSILDYTKEKLNKLETFTDKIVAADVYLKLDNAKSIENKTVEVRLQIPGDDIVVSKNCEDLKAGVDESYEVLKRLVIKNKEKSSKK